MGRPILRILVADDHPLFREALRFTLAGLCPGADFADAASYEDLIATTVAERFDVIFLDLGMPGGDDSVALRRLRENVPHTPLVVVSAREDRLTIRTVADCGAAGFIGKSEPREAIIDAVRRILGGERRFPGDAVRRAGEPEPLTPRQSAVLEELVHGCSNRQIAAHLGIEEVTVKVHISAILRKLGVKNRLAAVAAARSFFESDRVERSLVR